MNAVLRAALALLLALAAFGVVSGLIARAAPPLDSGGVSDKLGYFAAHKDRYDVVFFGSSHVERGVMPRVFDAELTRRGHRLRSFNFATGGMFAHETNALIRRVLALEPRRLRWVLVELSRWHPMIWPGNEFTQRAIAWHDLAETRAVIASALSGQGPLGERLRSGWMHLLHMGALCLPVGRGPALLLGDRVALADSERWQQRERPSLDESQGHLPFPTKWLQRPGKRSRRREFLADLEGYAETLRELPGGNAQPIPARELRAEATLAQIAMIRAAGAEPVYFIAPNAEPTPHAHAAYAAGLVPVLLAFDDPEAYPELYRPEHRFDPGHLSAEGAELFSRALAERFAALLPAADLRR